MFSRLLFKTALFFLGFYLAIFVVLGIFSTASAQASAPYVETNDCFSLFLDEEGAPLEMILRTLAIANNYDLVVKDLPKETIYASVNCKSPSEAYKAYTDIYNLCTEDLQNGFLVVSPCEKNEVIPNAVSVSGRPSDLFQVPNPLDISGNEDVSFSGDLSTGYLKISGNDIWLPLDDERRSNAGTPEASDSPRATAKVEKTRANRTLAPISAPSLGTARPNRLITFKLRIFQIADNSSLALGFDWDQGIVSPASALVEAGKNITDSFFPSEDIDNAIKFLERNGVAERVEEFSIFGSEGHVSRFQNGGSLNVSLVGAGQNNIERTFNYGFTLEVEPERVYSQTPENDKIGLGLVISDSAPVSATDPNLLNLSNREVSSYVQVACGTSIILNSLFSRRGENSASGIPIASSIPYVGYAFGYSQDTFARTTLVQTLDSNSRPA